jgi:hypothetical protein
MLAVLLRGDRCGNQVTPVHLKRVPAVVTQSDCVKAASEEQLLQHCI